MKKGARPSAAGRKLKWSTHESLRLHSEKIDAFLERRMLSQDEEHAKAADFFKKIRLMMDDSNWVITTRRADYRALNRTGGTIRSIQATVDFYADDVLFYVADIKRTLIEADRQVEISADILVYDGEPIMVDPTTIDGFIEGQDAVTKDLNGSRFYIVSGAFDERGIEDSMLTAYVEYDAYILSFSMSSAEKLTEKQKNDFYDMLGSVKFVPNLDAAETDDLS